MRFLLALLMATVRCHLVAAVQFLESLFAARTGKCRYAPSLVNSTSHNRAELDRYNHRRYRESPDNIAPADTCAGRAARILKRRERSSAGPSSKEPSALQPSSMTFKQMGRTLFGMTRSNVPKTLTADSPLERIFPSPLLSGYANIV